MFQGVDGSIIAQDMLAIGGALALTRTTNLNSIAEAFADTAVQLLSELETRYGLAVRTDLTTAQRQVRLLATIRARISASPQDITTAAQTFDATARVVETTAAAVFASDPNPLTRPMSMRGVFRFAVAVSAATFANASLLAQLNAILQKMKPAHTDVNVTVNTTGFLFDDPGSLMDRDVFGS